MTVRTAWGVGVAVAAVLVAASAAGAQVAAPTQCRALPDYAVGSIVVQWDDVEGEDGYRVFHGEAAGGPFTQVSEDLPPDTTEWIDPGPDPALEHFYVVRAFDAIGESLDSNVFQQNLKVVWPNPGHHSLLHNWNELIGSAAEDGYHRGCDIQQVGEESDPIVFPRGGVVVRVGNTYWDNNHIYVEVRTAAGLRYDSFNHLAGKKLSDLGWDVGDYVRAGQVIQTIGEDYYTPSSVDFVDHVHFFSPNDPWTGEVDGESPLKIFAADEDRDPGLVRPAVRDQGLLTDGPVLFHRQGSAPGPPYLELPLGDDPATPDEDEGNVDVHVEISDLMGLGATQVPASVAWWIEGRSCDGAPPVVRSAAAPYVLIRWDDQMLRGSGVFWWRIADEWQDQAPYITYEGVSYPVGWHNFKHFILTNTHGFDGSAEGVDYDQYWNTNAADDGSPAESASANFAGLPDATRAAEARFPDGDYAIHVIVTDLLGEHEDVIPDVRLENFPPAVADSGPAAADRFFVDFSEPMEAASVESALTVLRSGIGPVPFTPEWSVGDCRVELIFEQPVDACAQYTVEVDAATAADLEGRLLDASYDVPAHDGVGTGLPEDTAITLYSVSGAVEVRGLRADPVAPGAVRLSWPPAAGAETYAISRGDLATLGVGEYGACLAPAVSATEYDDADVPDAGAGFFYLVRGANAACGPGPLARDSSGAERINLDPLACP